MRIKELFAHIYLGMDNNVVDDLKPNHVDYIYGDLVLNKTFLTDFISKYPELFKHKKEEDLFLKGHHTLKSLKLIRVWDIISGEQLLSQVVPDYKYFQHNLSKLLLSKYKKKSIKIDLYAINNYGVAHVPSLNFLGTKLNLVRGNSLIQALNEPKMELFTPHLEKNFDTKFISQYVNFKWYSRNIHTKIKNISSWEEFEEIMKNKKKPKIRLNEMNLKTKHDRLVFSLMD